MQRLADVGANNWVCKAEDQMHDMLTKLYDSPEFLRFAVFTGDLVLEHMIDSNGYRELADPVGRLMSTTMTTFFSLPSSASHLPLRSAHLSPPSCDQLTSGIRDVSAPALIPVCRNAVLHNRKGTGKLNCQCASFWRVITMVVLTSST